jgi:hypothetical protein
MRTKRKSRPTASPLALRQAAAQFDREDYSPRFLKAPADQRRRHDRAIRLAKRKRGRPPVGGGAERIQITVERTLLAEADRLARWQQMSRSELIARGLRMALAGAA